MNYEEIEKGIQKYKDYLNDGKFKPDWRIHEVECYIKVMTKVMNNKGIDNGKDGRTN